VVAALMDSAQSEYANSALHVWILAKWSLQVRKADWNRRWYLHVLERATT